jgi:transcriptional regulator with XRE-family HTH domain
MDGKRLRELRTAKGLSLEALAALAGCTHGAISRWENGLRRINVAWAERLEKVLKHAKPA